MTDKKPSQQGKHPKRTPNPTRGKKKRYNVMLFRDQHDILSIGGFSKNLQNIAEQRIAEQNLIEQQKERENEQGKA